MNIVKRPLQFIGFIGKGLCKEARLWGLLDIDVIGRPGFSKNELIIYSVYYTLLVVIIICIMFVKLRKCWRML